MKKNKLRPINIVFYSKWDSFDKWKNILLKHNIKLYNWPDDFKKDNPHLERIWTDTPSVIYKGSGFYSTDYKSTPKSKSSKNEKKDSSDKKNSKKSSEKKSKKETK